MLLRLIPSIGSSALFLAVLAAWPAPPPHPPTVSQTPIIVEVPAVPSVVTVNLPPPPTAPPAAPPRRAIHEVPCATDPARIGTPLASMPLLGDDDPPVLPSTDVILTRVAARGCVIAAWSEGGVVVSRDGGRTFARALDGNLAIHDLAIQGDRVVVALGDRLGIQEADGAERWRPLPFASDTEVLRLLTDGDRIGLSTRRAVAFTADDGETWRIDELPPADAEDKVVVDVLPGGGRTAVVRAFGFEDHEREAGGPAVSLHVGLDELRPAWRRDGATLLSSDQGMVVLRDEAGHVDLVRPNASSTRLLGLDLGDHDGDGEPDRRVLGAAQRGDRVYVATTDSLYLATPGSRGARMVYGDALDHDWWPEAVDGHGHLIAIDDEGRVLRWSKRGGWRILLDGAIDAGDEGDCDCC